MKSIRSLLFAPGNRFELLKKFPRYAADCFVIDLEDGTAESEKAVARQKLPEAVAYLRRERIKGQLFVRINEARSLHAEADLAAALQTDIDGVVVPKLGTLAELKHVANVVSHVEQRLEGRTLGIIGCIETIAGIVNARALAAGDPHLCALCFGAEDFITEMNGRRTVNGHEVLYARSQTVLAAKAAGIDAIDQAVVNIRDENEFIGDAQIGRDLGYGGKICLTPRQAELANVQFSPTAEEIARSHRLIAAAAAGEARGHGAIDFEGRMIDGPLLKRARAIVELADRMRMT